MALKVELFRYSAPFMRPIETARALVSTREGLILSIRRDSERGPRASGLGEAACWPGFGSESLPLVERALCAVRSHLRALSWPLAPSLALAKRELEQLRQVTLAEVTLPPEAWAALSSALLDLSAQEAEVSLASYLNPAAPLSAASHQLIDGQEEALRALRGGARALKVKVARAPIADERARLMALREQIGPTVKLRLDANEGWSLSEAEAALQAFAPLAPEWVEAPFRVDGEAGIRALAALRQRSPSPLAADESLRDRAQLIAHLDHHAADIYVLKPLFLGGLIEAAESAALISQRGGRCCITHALGTQIERRGALQLSAALEAAGLVTDAGLGGQLSEDLAAAPERVDGRLLIGATRGLGLTLQREGLSAHAPWFTPVRESARCAV